MPLNVYFAEDIRDGLIGSVLMAIETAIMSGSPNVDHLAGVMTMGKAQAARFGISWRGVIHAVRRSVGCCGEVHDLIESAEKRSGMIVSG